MSSGDTGEQRRAGRPRRTDEDAPGGPDGSGTELGALPVALVTGATRGLGREIARVLAPDHHLLLGGRDPAAVGALATSLPSAEPFVADLTDARATRTAVTQVLAPLGRLDVLVHNAGISSRGTVADTPREQWRRMLEVNVVAVADLTRLVLPLLRRSRGLVVLVNSGAGQSPSPGNAAYSASKFALGGLAQALREEERGRVRVTSVHPGRIDTDMQVALQAQDGRPYVASEHMAPADVARTVRLAVDMPVGASVEELRVRPWAPRD